MKKFLVFTTGVVVGVNVGMYFEPWLPAYIKKVTAKADALYLERRKYEMGDEFDK